MKIKILRKNIHYLSLFVGLICIPVFYQNCSAPPEESRDIGSVAENLEMSFAAKIDHIAYMSCSNMGATNGYDNEAYFTFKAGAYSANHGIKLNQDFFYQARNLMPDDQVRALQESPINSSLALTMAVRAKNNLQVAFPFTGAGANSANVGTFVGSLTQDKVASVLVDRYGNSYENSFPGAEPNDFVDSTMQITGSESVSSLLRTELDTNDADQSMLTITFNPEGNPNSALGPEGSNKRTSAYGYGYTMRFIKDPSYTSAVPRIMTNVTEYNLTNNSRTESPWACDPNWVFKIVRQEDAATHCPGYANEPTNPDANYIVLRQILRPDQWGVNMTKRCIVPKKTGFCYGGNTTIAYGSKICDAGSNNCPHYLSICKRRSS